MEVIYSANSDLRSPGNFVSKMWSDLRVAPPVAWRLFLRSLQAGYRKTWLGYFWLLIPPLATTATWVYLHSARLLDVGTTSLPYPVYVLTGTLLWQVFSEALHSPLQQLTSAKNILTKSKIPHEALLLVGIVEVLFNFAVRLVVLLPVFIWFGTKWDLSISLASILLVPLGVLALLLLGFSIGLLFTPLGLLYEDIPRGLNLLTMFWFFLTPVIYPPPSDPNSFLLLNPVSPLLVTTRDWLTTAVAAPRNFIFVIVLSILTLSIAWLFQRLARPHVVARIG